MPKEARSFAMLFISAVHWPWRSFDQLMMPLIEQIRAVGANDCDVDKRALLQFIQNGESRTRLSGSSSHLKDAAAFFQECS